MKSTLFILFLFISLQTLSQSISIEPSITPEFFAADEPITITYDATGTSLSALSEAWIWLWLPDQTDENVTSNVNPANSNATASNPAKFSRTVESGKVYFSITLTLTTFSNMAKEDIKQVGMLIKGNDWSDGQSTDFITSVTTGYSLKLESPSSNYDFYEATELIEIVAKTSETSDIEFYVDDVLTNSTTSSVLFESTHQIIADGAVHVLKISASNGVEVKEKQYSYTINPSSLNIPLPEGIMDGINYNANQTSVTLVLLAPNKDNVFVLGDFNNWSLDSDYLMNKDGERFWLTIDNLTAEKEYIFQYLIDGKILIADPYTDKVSDPWDDKYISEITYPNLISYPDGQTNYRASVLQTGQIPFNWQSQNFTPPAKEDLVVYELLIRDFDTRHSYKAVLDKLDYLQSLGINAIEFMPTNEFEGNESWGYNPNFYFAPDKYYGTKNDFKALIDACHSRGIAVIIDLVLNHSFNSSPLARMYWNEAGNRPASNNPWYNEFHNFQNTDAHWGSDFNHESAYTQNLVDSINSYWINEYKVDGFRFDFTKGFGNNFKSNTTDSWGSIYDADRIALLKRMTDKIWSIDPNKYVIFEHLAENREEKELADYGIMLWGNMNSTYRNVARANNSSLASIYHENRGWDQPNLIGYMESHDEERVAWDVLRKFNLTESMQRLKLNGVFFFTVPGPKMIWQFGEMGYDEELNNNRLGIKPIHWEYLEDVERKNLFDVYTSLINLKAKSGLINEDYFSWKPTGDFKWINITSPEVAITIVGNFGLSTVTDNANFTSNGTWFDYFSGEMIDVTDYVNQEITLQPGEFKIYTSKLLENYIDNNPAEFITSLETIDQSKTLVFPNPAKEEIYINIKSIEEINIVDLAGKKVNGYTRTENIINVVELPVGVYIISVKLRNGKMYISRFIKE